MAIEDSGLRLRSITLKDSAVQSMQFGDGISNLVSGLGVGGRDQQASASYWDRRLDKATIDASFASSWLSKKVHKIPATDCVRAGWTHAADDVDITKIEAEERRLDVRGKLRRAILLQRLYGGAGIFMGVGNDDPRTPLDVNRVKAGDLRYLDVISRHRLTATQMTFDPGSPFYGMATMYQRNGLDIHPSRIIKFSSDELDEDDLFANGGWGRPLLESLWSALINADTAQGIFASLLTKAKTDTISIPGLAEVFATQESEDRFRRRLAGAQLFESVFSTKLIASAKNKDDVGESWGQFQINWAGIPEVAMMFVHMVAGASDIPATRLLGKSPDGMNASGQGDQANYDQFISSIQELDIRPRHEQLNEVLYRSALGVRPASIWLNYNPLSIDSDEVKAKNAKARAEATAIYNDSGLIPSEVLQEAVKGQLIESGEYPGIEQAYQEYAAGTLEGIVEEDEPEADDPLIPVDENGQARLNRESRLFAANDMVAQMLADGIPAVEATKEARRLTDAEPRPVYVSRRLINAQEVREWYEKQGIAVTVANDRQHVTVIYSKAPVDWMKAGGGSWGTAELTVPAGGPRMMDRFGPSANALVLMFASSELSWRHRELLEAGCSHDFDYHCHVTLSYEGQDIDLDTIVPYKGELRFSFEDWQEIQEDWSKR